MALRRRNKPGGTRITIALLLLPCGIHSPAFGDAGVFAGNGQNLHQITTEEVQLATIDVRITLGRGRFLFDGTVPGMDQAEYSCTFVLRNLANKPVEVQVGFPVDSMFADRREPISSSDSKEWVLRYGFIARDNRTTYHAEFVRRTPRPQPGEFASLFVWKMRFDAGETRTLDVQYCIPMSMGLVGTRKEEIIDPGHMEFPNLSGLDEATMEFAGYITSTGSSWAGNVERAMFTVITDPFERYLNHRGWEESLPLEMADEKDRRPPELMDEMTKVARDRYPVQHPWSFRKITPDGWQKVEGGVQWEYKDFKPKDAISVAYYLTQFPGLQREVGQFVELVRRAIGNTGDPRPKLRLVRELLLATYGREPDDAAARAFASAQFWYAPRKDFKASDLTDSQKAVLKELDARIAQITGAK
jgi:hypothetical protein